MTTEPKIIRSTWANLWDGRIGDHHPTRADADRSALGNAPRIAVLRRDFFEDGTCKATLEDV